MGITMKYIAIIDADEKPVSCEFIGCNGNVAPYLIGATTNIKSLEQMPVIIPYLMHKEMDISISECQKAYSIAMEYLRSQVKIKG